MRLPCTVYYNIIYHIVYSFVENEMSKNPPHTWLLEKKAKIKINIPCNDVVYTYMYICTITYNVVTVIFVGYMHGARGLIIYVGPHVQFERRPPRVGRLTCSII